MSQTVLIKRSSVAAKVPTTAQLSLGELALNTYDGKLYLKKNVLGVESVVEVGAITVSGDATGSGNGSITLTLANSGVAAGTYPKVTVDAKGRVTSGASLAASDIPALDWSKITSGKPTTLAGYGITDAATSTHAHNIISANDTRSTNPSPWTYPGLSLHLKSNTTDSLVDGGTYHAVLNIAQWTDSSGGASHQLGMVDSNHVYHRSTIDGTTFTSWERIIKVNPSTPKDGDVKVVGSVVSVYAGGAWRQVFPAVYS